MEGKITKTRNWTHVSRCRRQVHAGLGHVRVSVPSTVLVGTPIHRVPVLYDWESFLLYPLLPSTPFQVFLSQVSLFYSGVRPCSPRSLLGLSVLGPPTFPRTSPVQGRETGPQVRSWTRPVPSPFLFSPPTWVESLLLAFSGSCSVIKRIEVPNNESVKLFYLHQSCNRGCSPTLEGSPVLEEEPARVSDGLRQMADTSRVHSSTLSNLESPGTHSAPFAP